VATGEVAAAQEPGGPRGLDASWLILQRLDDLRRAQDEPRAEVKEQVADLRAEVKEQGSDLRAEIASLRNWSLGLLLLAILGLLAKPLIPGV
jgi:signal transduction histidine kinase